MTLRPAVRIVAALLSASLLPCVSLHAQASPATRAALRVGRLFTDGMLLQRDQRVSVWGWATPHADIDVSLGAQHAHATATTAGTWTASLSPQHAGGPFALHIRSKHDQIDVRDVYIGDVWVASGQSNMEFHVSQAKNAAEVTASAADTLIREFKVPTSWSPEPSDDLAGGAWARADAVHVGEMSAVAYFFAREIAHSQKVPIGIINTTWGGSNIETWISRPAQGITSAAWTALRQKESARIGDVRAALLARIGALPETDAGLVNGRAPWADPALDDAAWRDITVPGYWEEFGYAGLDGIAWYRHAFTLSEAEAKDGVTLSLAAIDDDDITWVNGTEVGRTVGYNVPRLYNIPPTALRAGRNLIAVRVADGGGGGGINAAATLVFGNGTTRSLAGTWKFKVGAASIGEDGQAINKIPGVLYNRMLHPITPFAIKGILWYQGESNANTVAQAADYRALFTALITSWRREFGRMSNPAPFLWVQLPGYGAADSAPPPAAAWATQRESMDAALSLPKTGRAIAIDLGEADNIHPRNKVDVGARLARVAQEIAYGERVVSAGPTYRSHSVRGDTIVVTFEHAAAGLTSRGTRASVGGFAIAGADRKFVWANATIAGSRVRVWSDQVTHPVAVRYAWDNNPDQANLFAQSGLPAAPFRTDRW